MPCVRACPCTYFQNSASPPTNTHPHACITFSHTSSGITSHVHMSCTMLTQHMDGIMHCMTNRCMMCWSLCVRYRTATHMMYRHMMRHHIRHRHRYRHMIQHGIHPNLRMCMDHMPSPHTSWPMSMVSSCICPARAGSMYNTTSHHFLHQHHMRMTSLSHPRLTHRT